MIRVRSDDAALRDTVADWLTAAAAGAPPGLELELRVVDAPWAGADNRAELRQPGLALYYGPPDAGIRAVWRGGLGHAWIPAGATRAIVDLGRDVARHPEQWRRPFLLPVVLILLRRVGWHHIHAVTARDPAGRGWLIAGNAHAGKSTTAALLATRGWAVGTDDTAFLVDDRPAVTAAAWREPIALRDGGRELLAARGGVPLARRRKVGYAPEELGGAWVDRVPVDIVATAALHDGATRLDPLPAAAAMGDLLSWSRLFVLEPDLAQQHLDLVGRLVRQAACFRLRLGRDLVDRPDLLRELLP
jgi:hypothetical protein